MKVLSAFILFIYSFILFPAYGQVNLKVSGKNLVPGETLHYKAKWGFLTIGSANTYIDKQLFKIGNSVCYKIDINGQTNGIAKLFYVRDKWTSYIDTASITSLLSYRSIREGSYELDESIHFRPSEKKAEVKTYNKKSKTWVLQKVYDTHDNVRDVVSGFMVFRLADLTRYKKGDQFSINGFYEDEGYKITVQFMGLEKITLDKKTILCYRLKPVVPKNKVFDGRDAVDVWLTADKAKTIVRLRARMFAGNIIIEWQGE